MTNQYFRCKECLDIIKTDRSSREMSLEEHYETKHPEKNQEINEIARCYRHERELLEKKFEKRYIGMWFVNFEPTKEELQQFKPQEKQQDMIMRLLDEGWCVICSRGMRLNGRWYMQKGLEGHGGETVDVSSQSARSLEKQGKIVYDKTQCDMSTTVWKKA